MCLSETTRNKSNKAVGVWLCLCILFLVSQFYTSLAKAEIKLTFGTYTTDQPTAMVKAYRPVLNGMEKALSKQLGNKVKISLKIASTYEKGIQELVQGNVDFSMLGPASYISAYKQNPAIKMLALESNDTSKTFNGVIAVPTDSHIQNIDQLFGKSFAFGNKVSTIGRYLSQAYLVDNGIGADDLSHYTYLGRHDRVGHAVGAGQYDAGALKEGTFNKLKKKGVRIRAIATFPNVNKAWIASSQLDDSIYQKLQRVMLEMTDESLFKPFSRKRFVAGGDEDYDVIRDAIENNQRFFTVSQSNTAAMLVEDI